VTSIPDELMPAFNPLVTAVKNWDREIFAYWEHPVTNAATEALNGIMKMVNRMGRGYTFDVLRAKILGRPQLLKRQRRRDIPQHRLVYVLRQPHHASREDLLATASQIEVGIDLSTLSVMTASEARAVFSTPDSE
jgi:transposase